MSNRKRITLAILTAAVAVGFAAGPASATRTWAEGEQGDLQANATWTVRAR